MFFLSVRRARRSTRVGWRKAANWTWSFRGHKAGRPAEAGVAATMRSAFKENAGPGEHARSNVAFTRSIQSAKLLVYK